MISTTTSGTIAATAPSDELDGEWRDTPHHSDEKSPLDPLGGADAARTRTGRWRERGPFGALLLATALLYLIGLSESGWANQFYAAAAQAGSRSTTS